MFYPSNLSRCFCAYLVASLCFISSSSSSSQVLPSSRSVNWSLSGYRGTIPAPADELNILSFGGVGDGVTDNSTALQNAMNALAGNAGVIAFPTGNFFFSSGIEPVEGVVLRGDGSENTTLTFDLGGGGHLINVAGSVTGTIKDFITGASKDDTQIVVQNTNGLLVGDYIRISQDDAALLTSNWAVGTVGQIVKIKSINGNTLGLESELRKDYDLADNPRIRKLNMIQNVGVECLKIVRQDNTGSSQTSNIRFQYAAQSWVRGVESDMCNYTHVLIDVSTNITVSGSYFHHAFSYGGGGRAYGVMIQQTGNENRIENNVFEHLRHSMIVQSGANGNVFGYNYSFDPFWTGTLQPSNAAGDMVCHGNYPYANLFEGNIAQQAVIDASHGQNGPLNTFFRSREELYGIVMTQTTSHQQNFIGNEIPNGPQGNLGLYILLGNDHFEHGNNIRGTVSPTSTSTLTDASYYHVGTPPFFTGNFPSIGIPNVINTGSIPAKDRVIQGGIFTACPSPSVIPLPVELISFEGKLLRGKVLLEWMTASEIDHDYFTLERSREGNDFEFITKIKNTDNSDSQYQKRYEYLDTPTASGLHYYRLSQTDKNGSTTTFPLVSVKFQSEVSSPRWKIFPTVFSESITIQNDEEEVMDNISVVISNAFGKQVKIFSIQNNSQTLSLYDFPRGVYFLTILKNKQVVQSEKIISY